MEGSPAGDDVRLGRSGRAHAVEDAVEAGDGVQVDGRGRARSLEDGGLASGRETGEVAVGDLRRARHAEALVDRACRDPVLLLDLHRDQEVLALLGRADQHDRVVGLLDGRDLGDLRRERSDLGPREVHGRHEVVHFRDERLAGLTVGAEEEPVHEGRGEGLVRDRSVLRRVRAVDGPGRELDHPDHGHGREERVDAAAARRSDDGAVAVEHGAGNLEQRVLDVLAAEPLAADGHEPALADVAQLGHGHVAAVREDAGEKILGHDERRPPVPEVVDHGDAVGVLVDADHDDRGLVAQGLDRPRDVRDRAGHLDVGDLADHVPCLDEAEQVVLGRLGVLVHQPLDEGDEHHHQRRRRVLLPLPRILVALLCVRASAHFGSPLSVLAPARHARRAPLARPIFGPCFQGKIGFLNLRNVRRSLSVSLAPVKRCAPN